MPFPYRFHPRAEAAPVTRSCTLLLTALRVSAWSAKSVPQSHPFTSVAKSTPALSMKTTLLAVAQQHQALREQPFFGIFTASKRVIRMSGAEYNGNEKYQERGEKADFTRTPISPSSFTLTPTSRFPNVLSHATNADSLTPRICPGPAPLSALTSLRQINPDKFMAGGTLTPTLDAWIMPEIMRLSGPSRNHPAYVLPTLIFLRNNDARTVERL